MSESTVWVVADGVELFVDDEKKYVAGDVVVAEYFESIAEFKQLILAGKIIEYAPSPDPDPEEDWDYFSIDDEMDEDSPNPVKNSALVYAAQTIMASSKTITGPKLFSKMPLRILFTAAITGLNTTTALTLVYNGTSYAVKVGKQGALANFVATLIGSTYYYMQAYTTLDLVFDGTQFIIVGNPVVLSSADYTIYADGTYSYKTAEQVFTFDQLNYGTTIVYVLLGLTTATVSPIDIDFVIGRGGIQVCLTGNLKFVSYYGLSNAKAHWNFMNGNRNESFSVVNITYNGEKYYAMKFNTTTTDSRVRLYGRSVFYSYTPQMIASTDVTENSTLTNSDLSS